MARGKRPLKQVLQIAALAILHVVNMPRARRCILGASFETQKAARIIDIARIVRDDEYRIGALHRDDAHNSGKHSFTFGAEHLLQLRRNFFRSARTGGKQRIGLTCEHIGVEGLDHSPERLPHSWIAADDQSIAAGIRGNLPPFRDIGLEDFH